MKRWVLTVAAGLLLGGPGQGVVAADGAKVIELNPATGGLVFEGIGGVSAGASSRLLIDYPEPERSEILDYLFKPQYGASLQHLKVEIGGDVNSTDGVESSHMHGRTDENYTRGYEWWLMKEAKKRNPAIILDTLAWGAPGWIGNGKYYSQDMADYVVKFIKGAKRVHGLDIQYTGIWNERAYDITWIKLLRKTLDANGLGQVGIIVADQCENVWKIAEDINHDPELKAAVFAIGVHYPRCKSTPAALQSGKRLWSSEDGPWSAEWNAAASGSQTPLQITYNRNYIVGKMVKTEIWSPITCYYDNLPLPGSGLMCASSPWSGHYELPPALWVTAHTTQFVQPGWQYLDSACLLLPGVGSVVALQAPNGHDYSVIIETTEAKVPQTLSFKLSGRLSSGTVHEWRTNCARAVPAACRNHTAERRLDHHGRCPECLFADDDHGPAQGWGDSATAGIVPARVPRRLRRVYGRLHAEILVRHRGCVRGGPAQRRQGASLAAGHRQEGHRVAPHPVPDVDLWR